MIAPKRMMTWPSGAHANTFGGQPGLACAAANVTISPAGERADGEREPPWARTCWSASRPGRSASRSWGRARPGPDAGHRLVEDRVTKPGPRPARSPGGSGVLTADCCCWAAGTGAIRLCPPLVLTQRAGRRRANYPGGCVRRRAVSGSATIRRQNTRHPGLGGGVLSQEGQRVVRTRGRPKRRARAVLPGARAPICPDAAQARGGPATARASGGASQELLVAVVDGESDDPDNSRRR